MSDRLTEKEEKFKEFILEEEKASLANIVKTDDKQMIAKIVRSYEEMKKNDNK